MKTKKRHDKGELAKPIYAGSIPIEGTNQELPEWIVHEAIEKLPLLMEHYEVDNYFSLALVLAMKYEPGFQIKQAVLKLKHGTWGAVIRDGGPGRPTIWTLERLVKLLNAVEETKQRQGCATDREALSRLARRGEWSPPANYRGTAEKWLETLESRLQDAKRIEREERDGGPALDPKSEAILRELERLATATVSTATVYATLPLELRFTALCLPFSIEQNSGN